MFVNNLFRAPILQLCAPKKTEGMVLPFYHKQLGKFECGKTETDLKRPGTIALRRVSLEYKT